MEGSTVRRGGIVAAGALLTLAAVVPSIRGFGEGPLSSLSSAWGAPEAQSVLLGHGARTGSGWSRSSWSSSPWSRMVQLAEGAEEQMVNASKAEATSANQNKEPAQVDEDDGACKWPKTPDSYVLKEDFWAFLQTVRIRSGGKDGKDLGYVQSHAFSAESAQTWYSAKGEVIATGRRDMISFVANIYIGDCTGREMAIVEETLVASPSSQVTLLTVEDPEGNVLATSKSSEEYDKKVQVIDSTSHKAVVEIERLNGWNDATNSWAIQVKEGSEAVFAADPRIIVISLAAESGSVAWGFGALPFILFLAAFGFCICLGCIQMMRRADPKDPRLSEPLTPISRPHSEPKSPG